MPLIDCAYCEGSARVKVSAFEFDKCPVCKGRGQIDAPPPDERVPCRLCNSSGSLKSSAFSRRPCDKCGGIGYRHVPKTSPPQKSVEVIHLKGDKPYSDRRELEEIIQSLDGDVLICETFLNEDSLDLLRSVPTKCQVNVLLGPKVNAAKLSLKISLFKKEHPNFTFKQYSSSGLHDRYIVDDHSLIILGYGLQRAGIGSESFAIILNNEWIENIKDGVMHEFNNKWNSGNSNVL